jgi:hypothetical protein
MDIMDIENPFSYDISAGRRESQNLYKSFFCYHTEMVFFKLLLSPELIPPAYVAWRAGATALIVLGS